MCAKIVNPIIKIFLILLFITGCTVNPFLDQNAKKDLPKIDNQTTANTECIKINLSEDKIDNENFKKLLSCLNNDGSLEPIVNFVKSLNENELKIIVSLFNEKILQSSKNQILAYDAIYTLEEQNLLKEILFQVSIVFKNEKFVKSFSRILKTVFYKDNKPDLNSFYALKILLSKTKDLNQALEFFLEVLNLKSIKKINETLLKSSLTKTLDKDKLDFKEQVISLKKFLNYQYNRPYDSLKILFKEIESGFLFNVISNYLKNYNRAYDELVLDLQIYYLEEYLKALYLNDNQKFLYTLNEFFYENKNIPLSCFNGSVKPKNLNDLILDRVLSFNLSSQLENTISDEIFKLKLSSAFCEPAKSFNKLNFILSSFFEHKIANKKLLIEVGLDFLQALSLDGKNKVLDELLFNVLSEKNEYSYTNFSQKLLSDLLDDNKKIFSNFFYFLNYLIKANKSQDIQDFISHLLKPRSELNGLSVYELFANKFQEISDENFVDFFVGLKDIYLNSDFNLTKLIELSLQSLQIDGVNNLVNYVLSLDFSNQSVQEKFKILLNTLENKNFNSALEHVSVMSQKGLLQEIALNSLKFLNPKVSSLSASFNKKIVKPKVFINQKYNRSTDDVDYFYLTEKEKNLNLSLKNNVCFDLDLTRKLFKIDSNFSQDFDSFLECASFKNKSVSLNYSKTLSFLKESNAKDIFKNLSLTFNTINFIPDLSQKLGDWIQSQDSIKFIKNFSDFFDSLNNNLGEYFIHKIFSFFKEISLKEKEVLLKISRNFLDYNSKNLAYKFFEIKNLFFNKEKSELKIYKPAFLLEQKPILEELKLKIIENELNSNPSNLKTLEALYNEKIYDYFYSVDPNQKVKRFDKENFEKLKGNALFVIENLLKNDALALKNFLSIFLKVGREFPDLKFISGWVERAALSLNVISYYPEGSDPYLDKPKTMLFNDLDMIELVAINADFSLKEIEQPFAVFIENPNTNYAVKYFTLLAQAQNLDDYLNQIEADTKKFQKLVSKKSAKKVVKKEIVRRLYNLSQVSKVLAKMHQRKFSKTLSDLNFIQEFCKLILNATPLKFQNDYRKEVNSTYILVKLAQTGFYRNIGRLLVVDDGSRVFLRSVFPYVSFMYSSLVNQGTNAFNESALIGFIELIKFNNFSFVHKLFDGVFYKNQLDDTYSERASYFIDSILRSFSSEEKLFNYQFKISKILSSVENDFNVLKKLDENFFKILNFVDFNFNDLALFQNLEELIDEEVLEHFDKSFNLSDEEIEILVNLTKKFILNENILTDLIDSYKNLNFKPDDLIRRVFDVVFDYQDYKFREWILLNIQNKNFYNLLSLIEEPNVSKQLEEILIELIHNQSGLILYDLFLEFHSFL
jgi:hypothetical protein